MDSANKNPLSDRAEAQPGCSEKFSIDTLLLCAPAHDGKFTTKTTKILDVTARIGTPNALAPKALITVAHITLDGLSPSEMEGIERYRCLRSGCKNFTLYARRGASGPNSSGSLDVAIAHFKASMWSWHSTTIHLPASLSAPTHPPIALTMSRLYSRSHVFVFNSRRYEWRFVGGAEIQLLAEYSHSAPKTEREVLAKFWFLDQWFASRGLLALSSGKKEGEGWETVAVCTLFGCLRREREWRYNLVGHGIALPRSVV